jgi:hypothetical protein
MRISLSSFPNLINAVWFPLRYKSRPNWLRYKAGQHSKESNSYLEWDPDDSNYDPNEYGEDRVADLLDEYDDTWSSSDGIS